jgi:rhodanese-related sulfurtransferase
MPLDITKGYRQLVAEAEKEIETISAADALGLQGSDDVVFVDLRDVRELWREGMIPGAFHCPRGMLEFWIDPDCIYYKDIFACGRKFIFYCNLGWRSALAAQVSQQMGLSPVAHIGGGFDAWKTAGGPVVQKDAKK